MKNFLIKLGAAIFYGILTSMLLTGVTINNYHFKGLFNIVLEIFK